jgi:hypothetical protein
MRFVLAIIAQKYIFKNSGKTGSIVRLFYEYLNEAGLNFFNKSNKYICKLGTYMYKTTTIQFKNRFCPKIQFRVFCLTQIKRSFGDLI